ncbi:MAG: hypothetical protein KKG02_06665 [Candidatus Edwardsbacteria bacterium]|nr:hypothetical protein [Candidatus Edwardsbacteria bacterium]MBU2594212.1 hypothetical protein [Candidatus Edwardsbacteria bacterium]
MDNTYLPEAILKKLNDTFAQDLYPFSWRLGPEQTLIKQGVSIRYSAMALIGIAAYSKMNTIYPSKQNMGQISKSLMNEIITVNNVGDLGLLLWALSLCGSHCSEDVYSKLLSLLKVTNDSVYNYSQTMWLSWVIDGLCAYYSQTSDRVIFDHIRNAANKLINNQDKSSGLFYRCHSSNKPIETLKSKIAFFSDQIYPTHALTSACLVTNEPRYLNAAEKTANRLINNQGSFGEWPWVYHVSTGGVVETYPIYSVHQHGMGPMALRRLGQANGKSYEDICCKSVNWLNRNAMGINMFSGAHNLVWRSQKRRHFQRVLTGMVQAQAALTGQCLRLPNTRLKIDYECRPYELGWLLYAESLKNEK